MESLTKTTIQEDINLQDSSALLWELNERKPEIRQIYGHFLPPFHRELVKGIIAKDFNFPPAAHDFSVPCGLGELYEVGEQLRPDTLVSFNDSVKIRVEKGGAIVYTSYFNGFYVNETAYRILKSCKRSIKVDQIASRTGFDLDMILNFLARALTLGIVNVDRS